MHQNQTDHSLSSQSACYLGAVMSAQAMTWAVEHELPCVTKMVLLMLANRTNYDTGECCISHQTLARDCGLSKDAVKKHTAKLEQAGLISIRRRTKDDVNLPNTYKLHLWAVCN